MSVWHLVSSNTTRFTSPDEHLWVMQLMCDARRPKQAHQRGILLGAAHGRLLEPRVGADRRHGENATHPLHAVPASNNLDLLILRADSAAAWQRELRHPTSRMQNDCTTNTEISSRATIAPARLAEANGSFGPIPSTPQRRGPHSE